MKVQFGNGLVTIVFLLWMCLFVWALGWVTEAGWLSD